MSSHTFKASVIGLGHIGMPVFESLVGHYSSNCGDDGALIVGVDLSQDVLDRARQSISIEDHADNFQVRVTGQLEDSDIYVIAIYSPEGIVKMLTEEIPRVNEGKGLIIIESTLEPAILRDERFGGDFAAWWKENHPTLGLVAYPHRLVPYDMANFGAFDMVRVMGGVGDDDVDSAINLYHYIKRQDIYKVSFNTAVLAKAFENAIRFMEIAFAQHLWVMIRNYNFNIEQDISKGPLIDFDELREAINSKWNIDLKEVRDGIGGSCLPKDTRFSADFFSDISTENIFELALASNSAFADYVKGLQDEAH